jgi:hypothetical protein
MLRSNLRGWTDSEISLIEDEIMFLDIFITDYEVNLVFDTNSAVKDAILKAFYSFCIKWTMIWRHQISLMI